MWWNKPEDEHLHAPPPDTDTDTCTEYRTLKEMLADWSQGGSQMLGYPNNFQWHLNGGLVSYLLVWLSFASQCGHKILVTVNNTNVWLFTHLTFVELHLTAGEGTDQHVDASCYEAVISHAVVYAVDSMRRVWTGRKRQQPRAKNPLNAAGKTLCVKREPSCC